VHATSPVITKHTLEESKNMSSKLILLAEDNTVNQKVAIRQLQKLGYRADAVGDGREAVEALARIPYDLVLMDCQMPEMDGYEATRRIRCSEGDHRHTPIVAMTANALEGDREKCIAAGMDDYVSKPVRVEELSRVIERIFARTAAADSAAPVDVARLHDVMGDTEEEYSIILDEYLRQMTDSLQRLDVAVGAHDYQALESIAHNCAGTSATCGMTAVVAPLRELESAGRAACFDNVAPFLSQTKDGFQRICAFLENYSPQHA
jgi:CheY-like chemotaxis protein